MFYMRAFRAQTAYLLRILSKFTIAVLVGGLYAARRVQRVRVLAILTRDRFELICGDNF